MAAKKPFIELERHLVIGIGQGSLTLDHKNFDGLEKWMCYYRKIADGSEITGCYMTAPVIRQLLKGERLQKDYEAAYELGRRYKNINAVLENQLAEAERIRDLVITEKFESLNEVHEQLTEAQDINRVIISQLKDLEFAKNKDQERHDSLQNRLIAAQALLGSKSDKLKKCEKDFNQLDSLLQTNKTELADITARQAKLHYKNLVIWKLAVIFLAILIIEMFFIFNA